MKYNNSSSDIAKAAMNKTTNSNFAGTLLHIDAAQSQFKSTKYLEKPLDSEPVNLLVKGTDREQQISNFKLQLKEIYREGKDIEQEDMGVSSSVANLSAYQLETPDFGPTEIKMKLDVLVKDFSGQVRLADNSILKGEIMSEPTLTGNMKMKSEQEKFVETHQMIDTERQRELEGIILEKQNEQNCLKAAELPALQTNPSSNRNRSNPLSGRHFQNKKNMVQKKLFDIQFQSSRERSEASSKKVLPKKDEEVQRRFVMRNVDRTNVIKLTIQSGSQDGSSKGTCSPNKGSHESSQYLADPEQIYNLLNHQQKLLMPNKQSSLVGYRGSKKQNAEDEFLKQFKQAQNQLTPMRLQSNQKILDNSSQHSMNIQGNAPPQQIKIVSPNINVAIQKEPVKSQIKLNQRSPINESEREEAETVLQNKVDSKVNNGQYEAINEDIHIIEQKNEKISVDIQPSKLNIDDSLIDETQTRESIKVDNELNKSLPKELTGTKKDIQKNDVADTSKDNQETTNTHLQQMSESRDITQSPIKINENQFQIFNSTPGILSDRNNISKEQDQIVSKFGGKKMHSKFNSNQDMSQLKQELNAVSSTSTLNNANYASQKILPQALIKNQINVEDVKNIPKKRIQNYNSATIIPRNDSINNENNMGFLQYFLNDIKLVQQLGFPVKNPSERAGMSLTNLTIPQMNKKSNNQNVNYLTQIAIRQKRIPTNREMHAIKSKSSYHIMKHINSESALGGNKAIKQNSLTMRQQALCAVKQQTNQINGAQQLKTSQGLRQSKSTKIYNQNYKSPYTQMGKQDAHRNLSSTMPFMSHLFNISPTEKASDPTIYQDLQDQERDKIFKRWAQIHQKDSDLEDISSEIKESDEKMKRLQRIQMLRQYNRSENTISQNLWQEQGSKSQDPPEKRYSYLDDYTLFEGLFNKETDGKALFQHAMQIEKQKEKEMTIMRDRILSIAKILQENFDDEEIERMLFYELFVRTFTKDNMDQKSIQLPSYIRLSKIESSFQSPLNDPKKRNQKSHSTLINPVQQNTKVNSRTNSQSKITDEKEIDQTLKKQLEITVSKASNQDDKSIVRHQISRDSSIETSKSQLHAKIQVNDIDKWSNQQTNSRHGISTISQTGFKSIYHQKDNENNDLIVSLNKPNKDLIKSFQLTNLKEVQLPIQHELKIIQAPTDREEEVELKESSRYDVKLKDRLSDIEIQEIRKLLKPIFSLKDIQLLQASCDYRNFSDQLAFLKKVDARLSLASQFKILSNVQAIALHLQQSQFKNDPMDIGVKYTNKNDQHTLLKQNSQLNHKGFQKSALNFSQPRQEAKKHQLAKVRINDQEIYQMRKSIGKAKLEFAVNKAIQDKNEQQEIIVQNQKIDKKNFKAVKTREMPIPIKIWTKSPPKEFSASSREMQSIYRSENTTSFGPSAVVRTPHYYPEKPTSIENGQSIHQGQQSQLNSKPGSSKKPRTAQGQKNIILQKRLHTTLQQSQTQSHANVHSNTNTNIEKGSIKDTIQDVSFAVKDEQTIEFNQNNSTLLDDQIKEVIQTEQNGENNQENIRMGNTNSKFLIRDHGNKAHPEKDESILEVKIQLSEEPNVQLIMSKQDTNGRMEGEVDQNYQQQLTFQNRKDSYAQTSIDQQQFSTSNQEFTYISNINFDDQQAMNIQNMPSVQNDPGQLGWQSFMNDDISKNYIKGSQDTKHGLGRIDGQFKEKFKRDTHKNNAQSTRSKQDGNSNMQNSQYRLQLVKKSITQDQVLSVAAKSSDKSSADILNGLTGQKLELVQNKTMMRNAYQLELINVGMKNSYSSQDPTVEAKSGISSQNLDLILSPGAFGQDLISTIAPRRILNLNNQQQTLNSSSNSKINSQSSELKSNQYSSRFDTNPYKSKPTIQTRGIQQPLLIRDDGDQLYPRNQQPYQSVSPQFISKQKYSNDQDNHHESGSSILSIKAPTSIDQKQQNSNQITPSLFVNQQKPDKSSNVNTDNINDNANLFGNPGPSQNLAFTSQDSQNTVLLKQNESHLAPELSLNIPGNAEGIKESIRANSNLLPTFKGSPHPNQKITKSKNTSQLGSKCATPGTAQVSFQPIKQKNLEALIQCSVVRGSQRQKIEKLQVGSKLDSEKAIKKTDIYDRKFASNQKREMEKPITLPQSQLAKANFQSKKITDSKTNSKIEESKTYQLHASGPQSSTGNYPIDKSFDQMRPSINYHSTDVDQVETHGISLNEQSIEVKSPNAKVQMMPHQLNMFKDVNSLDDLPKQKKQLTTHMSSFNQSSRQNLPFKKCHLSPKFKNDKLPKNRTAAVFNSQERGLTNKVNKKNEGFVNLKQPLQRKPQMSKSKVTNDALRNLYKNQDSLEQFNARVMAKAEKNRKMLRNAHGHKTLYQTSQQSFQLFPDLNLNSVNSGSQGSLPPIDKTQQMLIKKACITGAQTGGDNAATVRQSQVIRQKSQGQECRIDVQEDIQGMTELAMQFYKEQQNYQSTGGITPNESNQYMLRQSFNNASTKEFQLPIVNKKKKVVKHSQITNLQSDPMTVSSFTEQTSSSQEPTPTLLPFSNKLHHVQQKPAAISQSRTSGLSIHQLTASASQVGINDERKQQYATLSSFQQQVIDIQNQQPHKSSQEQRNKNKGLDSGNNNDLFIKKRNTKSTLQREITLGKKSQVFENEKSKVVGSRMNLTARGDSNDSAQDGNRKLSENRSASNLQRNSQKPVKVPRVSQYATIIVKAGNISQPNETFKVFNNGKNMDTMINSPLIIQEMVPEDRERKSLTHADKGSQ